MKFLVFAAGLLLLALSSRADRQASADWTAPARREGGGSLSVFETAIECLPAWRPSPASRDSYGLGAGFACTLLQEHETGHPDYRLYAFRIPMQASLATASRIRLLARLTPSLNTDLKEVDRRDFRLAGFLLALYPWRPNLQAGLGVALTDETGFFGLLPAAGLRWQATDRLDLDLFMPRPRLRYTPVEAWSFFAAAAPSGGQWNIGRGTPGDPERNLHLEGFQARLGTAWRPRPGVELTLSAGGLFSRSLKTDGPRGTEFRQRSDLADAPMVAFALQVTEPKGPRR